MNYETEYKRWLDNIEDSILINELNSINKEEIQDRFYDDLAFGTGGIRGITGLGTNRINSFVVKRVSMGLSAYLKNKYDNPSVVIGFDTRKDSNFFADVAADTFSSFGIKVSLFKEALPVSLVSYAVRQLKASAGIMITASHNSHEYNGYKVYDSDGCQITNNVAKDIFNSIREYDYFNDISINKKLISNIDDNIYDLYIEEIKKQSFLYDEEINKDIKIVYSPLNGAGLKPVTRVLKELGYNNIILVEKQIKQDGNFTTCPYPNPEDKKAMLLGIDKLKENDADIFIATDPDCDRVGVVIKIDNDYVLLNSNQVGVLLLDYICNQKRKHNDFGRNPVFIKTIVTTDMAQAIADKYNVETINVLTGYKYIGEQLSILEKENRLDDFVFSFEESAGYLSGTYVRDKDGVNAVCLVCEMFSFYKTHNISIQDKLYDLYKEYGYYNELQYSYTYKGIDGKKTMDSIIDSLRLNGLVIDNDEIIECLDYSKGILNLPKSNVLKFKMKSGSSLTIRPSGTEPKIKVYLSVVGIDKKDVDNKTDILNEVILDIFDI